MFSQLTVYAKIIYLLMVVISGALCTVEDYVIMSQCAHNKAIHLAAEGTVSVTDISQTQNITIVGLPDFVNNDYKIALYAKETKRYLCFNENWKLVGMQELQDTCYFNETIVHGYFVFRSVVDLQRRIGFTHRGKAIGPKKNVSNDACYMFTKIQADQFFHQHRAKMMAAPTSSATMTASTTATTSYTAAAAAEATRTTIKTHNKNNNYNNRRYHNKIQNQSHLNGHNSNISNKNHTNLSNNTKQQQQHHHTREHVQRQHLVRHHHNDPNAIARRQHHEQKQKRRQQQQQHQRARLRTTTTTKTTTASPKTTTKIKHLTNTAATTPITTTTTKRANTTTTRILVKNKHKGRKRKIESTQKKHSHHKQRLLHKLQQQRSQQYRTDATMSTTARTTSTTQTDADWSMSENWWSNFTDDYNNNTYNNNTDYGSNEWLSVDPSPVSPLFSSTLVAANEVSDSEDSLGYFSSSTMSSYFDPTKSSPEPFESTPSDSSWSSTSYTSLDIDFDNSQDNSSSESDTMPTDIWSSATPVLHFSPTTKVTFKQEQKGAVVETTTSTNDNDNSTNQFDLFTDVENADNSSDLLSMSEASVATTLNSFVINRNQQTTKQQANRKKIQRGRSGGSKSNKFVRKFAQPAATNAALTTKMHRASTPFLQTWSTKITTTPNPLNINKINNIIQISKNISESQIHNSLSDKLEPSTRRASFSTIATTKDKSVRKSTQKLLATPFHQLIQYVRNDAGEIDIDNIDNISIYPEVSEDSDIDYSAAQDSSIIMPHRRLAIVSGYLPTSASVVLPESIQIAKIKINKERKRLLRQRRRHGETDRILA